MWNRFPDRIEISNPGKLHNTLTPEDLFAGCQLVRRNQMLAGFMREYQSPLTLRTLGFRFNLIDLAFLLLLALISGLLFYTVPDTSLGWIPLYLGASFFLFCNVFRIGNHLEPFWYAPFTLCAGAGIYTMELELFWRSALFLLEPLKWGLIAYRIIRGPYFGAGYRLLKERIRSGNDHE